jgi:hypothetical protein
MLLLMLLLVWLPGFIDISRDQHFRADLCLMRRLLLLLLRLVLIMLVAMVLVLNVPLLGVLLMVVLVLVAVVHVGFAAVQCQL